MEVLESKIEKVLQDIEHLREDTIFLLNENAIQNSKIELLELQLKFVLNKLTGIEKLLENRNNN